MGYVSLVWLWESAKLHFVEGNLASQLFDDEFPLPAKAKWIANRDLNPSEVLRLIRNALSHGRVETTESDFIFNDHRPNGDDAAQLTVSWCFLGELCERVIHRLTPIIYPR
jgi:hypothetical protein